jgi:hypothetical protein
LKLTFEVPNEIFKRIQAAAEQKGSIPVNWFILCAIERELLRVECNGVTQVGHADLAAFATQLHRVENGQRAIIALLDSSATVLAALLRGRAACR